MLIFYYERKISWLLGWYLKLPVPISSVPCTAREACQFQLMSSNTQSIMAAHSDCRVRLINQHEILCGSNVDMTDTGYLSENTSILFSDGYPELVRSTLIHSIHINWSVWHFDHCVLDDRLWVWCYELRSARFCGTPNTCRHNALKYTVW